MNEEKLDPRDAIDFRGKTIETGVTVCYPVRRKSTMVMKSLVITKVTVTRRGLCASGTNTRGRQVNLYNLHNCIVVEVD